MKCIRTITALLLALSLCSSLNAQVIHIPDPNLRVAIRLNLNLPVNHQITRKDMARLTIFSATGRYRNISDLTGLEHAIYLQAFNLRDNPGIVDISPITNQTKLIRLLLAGCALSDIKTIRNLKNLHSLSLQANQIVDIEPLSNLTNLVHLNLADNQITDFSPLKGLINLKSLRIDRNLGNDYTPLQNLSIMDFTYDEVCDIPPLLPSARNRIETREFPSIFQAWTPVQELEHLTFIQRDALHDLFWSQSFGLHWDLTTDTPYHGLSTELAGAMDRAIAYRSSNLDYNPNMIFLLEIRIHNHFNLDAFPPDSDLWLRDVNGNVLLNSADEHLMDFTKPELQHLMANRIIAVVRCGLIDGVLLNGLNRNGLGYVDRHLNPASDDEFIEAVRNILAMVRENVREDFLIVANTSISKPTALAEFLNGTFLEIGVHANLDPAGELWLTQLEQVLSWAESNLREPQVNALEGWGYPDEPPDSPKNIQYMRAITALSLTHSDGYVMYNDGVSHRHIWYPFWDADLGMPVGPKAQRYKDIDGVFIREFTNGWAVYNRSGTHHVVELPEKMMSVSSGLKSTAHTLPNHDGGIYIKQRNPADINEDGQVNILDLVIVSQAFSTDNRKADVNNDGLVNVLDLVFIANAFK